MQGVVEMFVCLGVFFFFNDTATTEIYTLSLHDALPISRAASLCRLRCQLSVVAACIFLVANLLGCSRSSIQTPESSRVYFEGSFELPLCFLRLANFQQQTAELFANRNKRSRRNRMLAQNVFGICRPAQHLNRFPLFAFACCYPSRSRLHLQVKMALEIIELGILRRVS